MNDPKSNIENAEQGPSEAVQEQKPARKGKRGLNKTEQKAKERAVGRWKELIEALNSSCKKKCEKCGMSGALLKAVEDHFKDWDEGGLQAMSRSIRTKLRKELPLVIRAILREAVNGNCQHAKLIFELAAIDEMTDATEKRQGESLAKLLLSNLDRKKK